MAGLYSSVFQVLNVRLLADTNLYTGIVLMQLLLKYFYRL